MQDVQQLLRPARLHRPDAPRTRSRAGSESRKAHVVDHRWVGHDVPTLVRSQFLNRILGTDAAGALHGGSGVVHLASLGDTTGSLLPLS